MICTNVKRNSVTSESTNLCSPTKVSLQPEIQLCEILEQKENKKKNKKQKQKQKKKQKKKKKTTNKQTGNEIM